MARDYPAFLFYPEDFVAGTAAMPPLAVGVYIRCLCHQWHCGFVPDDMPSIARLSGATLEEVAAVWPAVSEKFSKVKAGYQNRRLEEERGKLKRRTKAGKKAAESRWDGGCDSDANGDANSMRNECEVDRSRVANANANADASVIELPSLLDNQPFRDEFALWLAYKKERREAYKPAGMAGVLSAALHRAEKFGVRAVIDAMQAARSNGWAGWNQRNAFGNQNGTRRDNSAVSAKRGERSL